MKNYRITVNGKTYDVTVEETGASAPAAPVAAAPAPAAKAAPAAAPAAPAAPAGAEKVTSPMPGTVLAVKVAVGQSVKKGETVVLLEAMKMDNEIPAPRDGVVASISVNKGSSVQAGDLLISLN
ncbi:MAG: acetyl-CoA carboxylase biotin carboxyl carrier protein subunit [Clostridia bacterium]|nr:acetyl-CoA carboxylase biotin carboxyl carrier protein subunit [Clostridia bacterium]